GLEDYIQKLLIKDTELVYNRYTGRDYYHIAHAYNLAVLASSGEYVAIMGADAILSPDYVIEARKLIADDCVWMRGRHYKGILVCQRQEFIDAGGYDERFEFYGGEDKDLELRLMRRGKKFGLMPDNLVCTLRTSDPDKIVNYRLPLTKWEMMKRGSLIRSENAANAVMVANEGVEWGQWQS
ncbi:MAG: galactosyltransferase-related protein, partial [Planctomycetota bacterium]